MDRDANYVAVGAFVIVVFAMATVFVLWYTNTHERREYQRYEVDETFTAGKRTEYTTCRFITFDFQDIAITIIKKLC